MADGNPPGGIAVIIRASDVVVAAAAAFVSVDINVVVTSAALAGLGDGRRTARQPASHRQGVQIIGPSLRGI